MIDWKKSAELNKCTIRELKAYFQRFNQSHKKVVVVCKQCDKERISRFRDVGVTKLCRLCQTTNLGKNNTREKMSEETLQKRRVANTGENNPRYGVKVSNATRKKRSVSLTGHSVSPEARAKSREKQVGRAKSEESCRHMSATKQGIPYDEWESFARESKYCPKFNNACRESNREKYGRECFICGKSEKANGRRLSVHHVDMNKAQGCEGNWKLVPLCMSCHAGAHNDELIARLGFMVKEIDS